VLLCTYVTRRLYPASSLWYAYGPQIIGVPGVFRGLLWLSGTWKRLFPFERGTVLPHYNICQSIYAILSTASVQVHSHYEDHTWKRAK
jgi:hypothetical protein